MNKTQALMASVLAASVVMAAGGCHRDPDKDQDGSQSSGGYYGGVHSGAFGFSGGAGRGGSSQSGESGHGSFGVGGEAAHGGFGGGGHGGEGGG